MLQFLPSPRLDMQRTCTCPWLSAEQKQPQDKELATLGQPGVWRGFLFSMRQHVSSRLKQVSCQVGLLNDAKPFRVASRAGRPHTPAGSLDTRIL